MKIIYLPSTKSDFLWFHEYYSSVFPDWADRALSQFDKTADLLSLNPYIWKVIELEVRQIKIINTPFSYIYRVTDYYIEVIRIWDDRKESLV